MKSLLLVLFVIAAATLRAGAHEEPTSFLDLRLASDGVNASLTASATDLTHDLPTVEPDTLLTSAGATAHGSELVEILGKRLHIVADGNPLKGALRAITPVPERRDVRLEIHFAWTSAPADIRVESLLFPYDSRHRTFLGIYENGALVRQEIFRGDLQSVGFQTGSSQGVGAVVAQFSAAGMRHIFIGPDHILFVIGLLLIGGGVRQLLKVITAFTIAHSLTLGLATFGIFTPRASLVEPAIALTIVLVGVRAFLGNGRRDPRLIFAFGFGLIHGFGFASVLQEMVLPRAALGWSLAAFNVGVEIGQGCIVAVVAPLLLMLRRQSEAVAARVVAGGALAVTAAGAFWFFQRIIS